MSGEQDKPEKIGLYEFFGRFPNEEAARLYFERNRWGEETACGHCGSLDVYECKNHKPMPYRCRDCRKHFSVRTGTVLAESRLGLHKWLMAIYMMTAARKGIPSTQMARELRITQKSAWFLAQRIRETCLAGSDNSDLGDHVEVDETYIGGKEKNKHGSKKLQTGRGGVGKTADVGIRGEKSQIRATPVASTSALTLKSYIKANVPQGASVVTDEFTYRGLSADGHTHHTINHTADEYFRHYCIRTNGIESFWALLKRGHYGIYQFISQKHLHRYVNEFACRQNNAQDGTMTFIEKTISCMVGKRLTYRGSLNA